MKSATLIALGGTHVVCPGCGSRIGVLRRALYQEHTFGLDAIEFAPNQEQRVTHEAKCRHCSTTYCEIDVCTDLASGKRTRTMLLHTDYGWLPKDPPKVQEPHQRVQLPRK